MQSQVLPTFLLLSMQLLQLSYRIPTGATVVIAGALSAIADIIEANISK
jgi:hypothetical protein